MSAKAITEIGGEKEGEAVLVQGSQPLEVFLCIPSRAHARRMWDGIERSFVVPEGVIEGQLVGVSARVLHGIDHLSDSGGDPSTPSVSALGGMKDSMLFPNQLDPGHNDPGP